jgi:hypothetical protein
VYRQSWTFIPYTVRLADLTTNINILKSQSVTRRSDRLWYETRNTVSRLAGMGLAPPPMWKMNGTFFELSTLCMDYARPLGTG